MIGSIDIMPMIPVSWLVAGFLSYTLKSSFYLPLIVTVFLILNLVFNIIKYNKSLSVKNKDQIKKTDWESIANLNTKVPFRLVYNEKDFINY